jgi:hypothetical protein
MRERSGEETTTAGHEKRLSGELEGTATGYI